MARKAKKGISVNLNDAESYFRPPVGTYELEVANVEMGESNSLAWTLKITSGKFKNKEFRDYTSLEANALWRLRGLVEATGADIEDADLDLDYFEGLVGESLAANVAYREYEGKDRINVSYIPSGGSDDDEAPPKRGKRVKDDDDEKPARGKKRTRDEEEEDEDEKPSKKGKKKPKAELTQEEIRDMDTDELEALIEEHSLDVDLSDFKTLKKQQSAVIDAASEAGLMAED